MPELSIIVPIYKAERYLEACLDSILSQTFKDFELILIDDGSPDQSGIICDSYALRDSRIVVIHQENKGVSATRNAGIDIAKGQYIGFIDSDDIISPVMYEILMDIIKNKNVDVVACEAEIFIDGQGPKEVLHDCERILQTSECRAYEDKNSIIVDLFSRPSLLRGFSVNKVYKKELLKEVRFPTSMKIWEDLKFLMEVYFGESCQRAIKISAPLYYYRMHEESATHGKESFVFRGKQFKQFIWSYIQDKAPQYRGIAVEYFLDSCFFHIVKYREIEKDNRWMANKNILKIKFTILYWIVYGRMKKFLSKPKSHRFFYEGIIRA